MSYVSPICRGHPQFLLAGLARARDLLDHLANTLTNSLSNAPNTAAHATESGIRMAGKGAANTLNTLHAFLHNLARRAPELVRRLTRGHKEVLEGAPDRCKKTLA